MKDDRNIEYLVGKKAKLDVFLEPFSFKIVSFLDDLSKALDNNSNNKNFPDLKALSFFCRKNNFHTIPPPNKTNRIETKISFALRGF